MPPVHEHIGFLKEMGLDFGWGTTAFVEWLLEHVHIYIGTPWWLSITLSMLIIRVSLLKLYFNAADAAARSQVIAPHMDPLFKQYQTALAQGNRAEAQKVGGDMKTLRRNAGISYLKQFAPFVQVPIGFGTFRLMRGMAYLPVPGLDTGGVLWFPDLTVPDPLFILPIATSAAYYFTFKVFAAAPMRRKIWLLITRPESSLAERQAAAVQ
jgi:YidC/Oxa1 family membrane protein insertase